jgi:hypothetical protein
MFFVNASQLILAVILFFLVNWIGKHSYSMGYVQISLFIENEDSPGINFLIRVLSPIVFIIIAASGFYYIGADKFVHNIYFVNIYYLIFRLSFGIITGRALLINWYKQVVYWLCICVLSYIVYDKIIRIKQNILPDFSTLSNELWIIIIVFIFQVINKINFSQSSSVKRRDAYLIKRYTDLRISYGSSVRQIIKNEVVEAICYAIIIYESFNRPMLVRIIENVKFFATKKPHTLGIMQVNSNKMISDRQSVQMGCEKVNAAFVRFKEHYEKDTSLYYGQDIYACREIIADYNTGEKYQNEVADLTQTILNIFYTHRKDVLVAPTVE